MSAALACIAINGAIPALVPGDNVYVGNGCVVIPESPTVLRRLADAITERAMVFTHPIDWDVEEARIIAERDRILARLETLAHERRSLAYRGAA